MKLVVYQMIFLLKNQPGFEPLLDLIISEIPAPTGDNTKELQFQPALLDYNEFVGRIGIGRVHNGEIHTGEMVNCVRLDGTTKSFPYSKTIRLLWL